MGSSVNYTPKITVLMPVYNCELYIEAAVESILNQTFSDFEFLIIDDASTDNTVSKIKKYQDSRINLIQKEKNTGYTNSLNYGLSIAKGKYIARMDGDDISLPERFEKQVAFMEANEDIVVCGTNFSIIGRDQNVKVPEFHKEIKVRLLDGNCIAHPSVFLRKSYLIENNISYDIQMEPAEDFDLWIRILKLGKLHNLQECLLEYRVYDLQVSAVRKERQMESAKNIRLKLLSYLKMTISVEQKKVYLKAIDDSEKLTLEEFLILLQLKKTSVDTNYNFFHIDGFRKYWEQIENRFNSYYFKNRNTYSLVILKDYLTVCTQIYNRLKYKDLIKLIIKSFIYHKLK